MMVYLLETAAFQIVFLLVYDFFLRRETFFQWNRIYLLVTFPLSLLLPFVKIDFLKTTVSREVVPYPDFLFQLNEVEFAPKTATSSFWEMLSTSQWILLFGSAMMLIWFLVKLFHIRLLKIKNAKKYYADFTKITVNQSRVAFSFFKNAFLGDQLPKERESTIIEHELVHIRQWHSLDLVLFELLRIVFWFNPLVYIYQNRLAEVHEFIADAITTKNDEGTKYQELLSAAFQVQNISFVNQFFQKSLLKNRISMMTKERSKSILQFKYLVLLPFVLGMLCYTSCEKEITAKEELEASDDLNAGDAQLIAEIRNELASSIDEMLSSKRVEFVFGDATDDDILSKEDYFRKELYRRVLVERAIAKKWSPESAADHLSRLPYPSTERYMSYVNRKKAFQLLDKNLEISIQKRQFDLQLINHLETYDADYIVIEIDSHKKLTANEIRNLNQKLDNVAEREHFNMVLKDDEYAFLITKKLENPMDFSSGIVATKSHPAQKEFKEHSMPFALADQVPIFPGCEEAIDKKACFMEHMNAHIKKHFNYPQEAQDLGVQGKVNVMFTINKEGAIVNVKKRGPHALLENEVVRIIGRLPKMKPGKHNGAPVDVPFSIPVSFVLNSSSAKSMP